jgi:integrase
MARARSAFGAGEAANPYRIEWTRFETGERLPLLARRDTGLPIEAPTYWIIASERAMNKAAATLAKQLRHVMLLYLWADARGCKPENIIRSREFFSLTQINDLDRFCRQRVHQAVVEALEAQHPGQKVVPRAGRRPKNSERPIARVEIRNRLAAVHAFLAFVSFDYASRLAARSEEQREYQKARERVLKVLKERSSALGGTSDHSEPGEGLDKPARERLLAVIEPGHSENPWVPEVQNRNWLIVRLLFELGMRRGEVLCLRVDDLRLTPDGGLMAIKRRPMDPKDPRQPKPQVKTLGRELEIGPALRQMIVDYLPERRKLPAARKHPFLFVSTFDGAPLSYSSLGKIFDSLRKRVTDLPRELTAHVLRHDWNDRFSEMSDLASPHRDAVEATKEERMRAYVMGWSSPKTAEKYTKRWTTEAANKRSLQMQEGRKILVERTDERGNFTKLTVET